MENNKKKALIKSVAAFTFAVSMFAAQSPAASAADVSAAGMLGHQIAHGESEESDEAEEAVDTTGDGDDDVNTDENAVAGEAAEAVGADVDDAAEESADAEAEVSTEENAENEAVVDEAIADEETDVAAEPDAVVENTGAAAVTEDSITEVSTAETAEEADEEEAEAEAYVDSVRSILGGANGYNVFVEGNYTQTGNNNIDVGDGGGVVAVGGNVDVGEGINHKGSSFEVGGSVTGTLQGDKVAVGEECTVDFKTAFNELRQTSSAISKVEGTTVSNGSDNSYIKSEYGTITLKGSDSDVNVFNMTVDEFNAMKTSDSMALRYDVPDGSTVILNIVGEGDVNLVFDWGAYYNGGSLTSGNKTGNSKVMINVPDGNNITIASGVGSLLAPNSSVGSKDVGYNPHYEGQVICKEFSGNIEFGSSSFDYTIKDTPETPDEPDTPETPDETDTPETPDETDTPETPDETDTPETPDEPDTPETPDETDTPETPDEPDIPETPDETDTPETPDEPDTPETPDETDTPETPDEPDTPETPDEPDTLETPDETDTPETPDEPDTPETPDETDTPETPDVPVTPPSTPDVPNVPVVPETYYFSDSPITPIIDFEMFDDTEVPLADSPIQETEESIADTVNEYSNADSFETFDDAPVPLADNPLGDTDADSYSVNPKTGVDMTVPMGAAAAAMGSFMALMIANKKRRDEDN